SVEEPVDLDVSKDYPNEVLWEGQPNERLILIVSKVLRNQRYPYERNTKDPYFTCLSQDGIAQSRLSVSKAIKIVLIDSRAYEEPKFIVSGEVLRRHSFDRCREQILTNRFTSSVYIVSSGVSLLLPSVEGLQQTSDRAGTSDAGVTLNSNHLKVSSDSLRESPYQSVLEASAFDVVFESFATDIESRTQLLNVPL